MAVTRARKVEQVERLGKNLQSVSTVIVTTYSKLTVAQDYDLRKLLRGSGAKYAVVKNTLVERAAKGTKVEGALKGLSGVTSIAYTEGDPVALAKALSKYAKDNPEFSFKTGVVEGRVISVKEIESLATMPSKEEIYSKLLFLISAPAQRLVTSRTALMTLILLAPTAVRTTANSVFSSAGAAAAPAPAPPPAIMTGAAAAAETPSRSSSFFTSCAASSNDSPTI